MKVILLLVCAALTLAARRLYKPYQMKFAEQYFEEFIETYNKNYKDQAEKQKRFEIFKGNLETINKMNSKSDHAEYGINMFTDLTIEEFLKTYTGLNGIGISSCDQKMQYPSSTAAPESFDWRDKQKVTRVKDQGHCGSCWAFSATGNLESQYAIKHNSILELSEQQLVDCDDQSSGCDGTLSLEYPVVYWANHGGAMPEQDYPYSAKAHSCKFDASKVKVNVTGCVAYRPENEDKLKDLLYEIGPLSIAVDARAFFNYKKGVIHDCPNPPELNHAVLLVGYGTDNGDPFWLIKNSWSDKFGEQGYVRVERGSNACGILDDDKISAVIV